MKILLVDDDGALRQVMSEVLDCLGYQVEAVGSLAHAQAALHGSGFDLILSDLCISGDRDGFLIMDFLDTLNLQVPVIFITGSGYGEWLISLAKRRSRPVGILNKPVTMSQLAEAIDSFCLRPLEQRAV